MTKEERRKSLYDCWQTAVNKHLGDYPIEDYANRARSEKDHWLFKLSDILHDNDYFTPKVKELEWKNLPFDNDYYTITAFGKYSIYYDSEAKYYELFFISVDFQESRFNEERIGDFETRKEAEDKAKELHIKTVFEQLEI